MAEDLKIREVNLNNKSRKGRYVYIRQKGRSGSYYKYKRGVSVQDYLDKYNQRRTRGKGKVRTKKVRRTKKIKIENIISKGVTKALIRNSHTATPYKIKNAYKKLLKPLIKDKALLDLMCREENIEKIQHRLSVEVNIIGERGEQLATLYKFKQATLRKVVSQIKEKIKVGMQVEDFSPTIKTIMEPLGYKYSHQNNGRVARVDIKIVFRKAK